MKISKKISTIMLPGYVELHGGTRQIHLEAFRLLKKYAGNGTPYSIIKDNDECVILEVKEVDLTCFDK